METNGTACGEPVTLTYRAAFTEDVEMRCVTTSPENILHSETSNVTISSSYGKRSVNLYLF